jgi:L-lactate dehydrogenase complex protein LldG
VDRDIFLSRVGRAAMTAQLPEAPSVDADLPQLGATDLVALFRDRAHRVDAVVHGPVSRHGAPKSVSGIAAGHDVATFVAWDDLPAPGVISALTSAGSNRIDHQVPGTDRRAHQLGYADLDLGITGADAGIAESGSVVLSHGPGRPRMASLVPRVHIALLEVDMIERTISHWAHRNPEMAANTANLVVVTGPSRTADIEQQLNLGVHGPRHLHIVVLK